MVVVLDVVIVVVDVVVVVFDVVVVVVEVVVVFDVCLLWMAKISLQLILVDR